MILFSLSWIATNYLFFLWWLPSEREFFISTTVPLIILLVLWVNWIGYKNKGIIFPFLIALLLLFNGLFFYRKHAQMSKPRIRANAIVKTVTDSTVVITDFFTEQYIEFFHHLRADNTDNVYRAVYGNEGADLLRVISSYPTLVISEKHFSPNFKVNGHDGILEYDKWRSGMNVLLKNVCSTQRIVINEESFWLLKRCNKHPISVDSLLVEMGIAPL